MLKKKLTLAFLISATQIATYYHLHREPIHPYVPEISQWVKTVIFGPYEYVCVLQQNWALGMTPFMYAFFIYCIYWLYTWIIESLGETWTTIIYATHLVWIIIRLRTPEEYLVMKFSTLVSKLF